jgi:hypothetical protein
VDGLGAALFAEPDRADLGQPALDAAAEIGVRLDPIHQQDVVGLESRRAHVDRHVVDGADLLHLHARDDRHADGLARDPVADEHVALALGRRASVTAHGRQDERVAAGLTNGLAAGAQDGRHVGDPAAARGDRDAIVERDAVQDRLELGSDARGDVFDGDLGDLLGAVDPLAGVQGREIKPHLRTEVRRNDRGHRR